MIDEFEKTGGFGGSGDVAGVFVLKTDDDALFFAKGGKGAQGLDDGIFAFNGPDGAPIGEYAQDGRVEKFRDFQCVFG